MSADHQNVAFRNHTILGVCEAIGEDLGFPPVLLRIAFAAALYFSPIGVVAAYFGLGLVVMISRFAVPEGERMWPFNRKTRVETGQPQIEAEAEQPMAIAA
ncbi:PspC domain-containing protein [Sphingosinicella sp. BN140058]|uniref:PspC domain-containing protein n=1 Tax=Sphingosinicella sp. BN140058 TaxID=1892855 RepID=UPI0010108420|nr:PspC domain-containing protein [Sphingosinicella sp. BN140058]QAY77850.1 PspC domain-containing protein [Sphingosinicella sp. BN140058]